MSGKGTDYKDRYITLPNRKVYNDMGQIVGEEPGGIFDAATGRAVQPDQPAKAGDAQAKAAQIKADAKAGKISRDEAIKQLQSLGYK